MEMGCGGIGIAGRTDGADYLPANDGLTFRQSPCVVLEVRVVVNRAAVGRPDIHGVPAGVRKEQLLDSSSLGGEDGGSGGSRDIERFVAALPARVVERIIKLTGLDPRDRDFAALPGLRVENWTR